MKFDISDAVKKSAAKKGLNGLCEAADSIIQTCDSRMTRNFLSGLLKSGEDALNAELNTKTVLPATKQPAEVTHIEQKEKDKEETGSMQSSTSEESASQKTEEKPAIQTSAQKVSSISD